MIYYNAMLSKILLSNCTSIIVMSMVLVVLWSFLVKALELNSSAEQYADCVFLAQTLEDRIKNYMGCGYAASL